MKNAWEKQNTHEKCTGKKWCAWETVGSGRRRMRNASEKGDTHEKRMEKTCCA